MKRSLGEMPHPILGNQFKDIDGNVLAQQRNSARPMHGHLGDMDADDLEYEYQVLQVSETGAGGMHRLNSMQHDLIDYSVADDD